SPTMPVPGYDVRVLAADGTEAEPGQTGDIVVRLPLPPGCLPTLWHDDERFVASYLSAHPDCYTTGDGGFRDGDGYVYVMGRVDDVINVAGHRLSTGQMEEVLASHPAVAECEVIGVSAATKAEVPRALVVRGAEVDGGHVQPLRGEPRLALEGVGVDGLLVVAGVVQPERDVGRPALADAIHAAQRGGEAAGRVPQQVHAVGGE